MSRSLVLALLGALSVLLLVVACAPSSTPAPSVASTATPVASPWHMASNTVCTAAGDIEAVNPSTKKNWQVGDGISQYVKLYRDRQFKDWFGCTGLGWYVTEVMSGGLAVTTNSIGTGTWYVKFGK